MYHTTDREALVVVRCMAEVKCSSSVGDRGSIQWFGQCPWQPGTPFHDHRPANGPSAFLAPTSALDYWQRSIIKFAKLEELLSQR